MYNEHKMVIAINRCVVISPKKEITDVYHNKF